MPTDLFIIKYKIGVKVKILLGEYTGQEAIYDGLQNNSNWNRLILINGEVILMNLEEFEETNE